MPTSPSDASFRHSVQLENDSIRHKANVVADLGQAVNDAWSSTVDETRAGLAAMNGYRKVVGEGLNSFGSAFGRNVDEVVRENRDDVNNAAHRISDHYRDRPATAMLEGPVLSGIDGMIRGGRHPEATVHQDQVHNNPTGDRPAAPQPRPTEHPAAPAAPGAPAKHLEDAHHHEVKKGDSYWSIAAKQGGTKAEIAAKASHIAKLNNNRTLLPNVDIVM